MIHHLIFEGAELSGKSFLMSQIYDYLEPKHNKTGKILDGCHWFNCDVGIYGTEYGKPVIKNYLKIFQVLKSKNLLIEKFYISDIVYNKVNYNRIVEYKNEEKELIKLNFKIILVIFPESKKVLEKRIADRLKLYPHYERILQNYKWYIKQQKQYLKEIKKTELPYLIVETKKLPDDNLVMKILEWIGD